MLGTAPCRSRKSFCSSLALDRSQNILAISRYCFRFPWIDASCRHENDLLVHLPVFDTFRKASGLVAKTPRRQSLPRTCHEQSRLLRLHNEQSWLNAQWRYLQYSSVAMIVGPASWPTRLSIGDAVLLTMITPLLHCSNKSHNVRRVAITFVFHLVCYTLFPLPLL